LTGILPEPREPIVDTKDSNVAVLPLSQLGLWKKLEHKRALYGFHVELTARCNNACRHCYINRPAGDQGAKQAELSSEELCRLADEAAALGALWCIFGGGEPLLRPDFPEIYVAFKRRGLLISVFTNAALITEAHVRLFQRYPPRDVEITVYGVTRATYEKVSGTPGSFAAFERGLDRLAKGGVPFRLKAMAMRSNVHELKEIASYCRARSKDYFRFDPFLHLRFDGDPARNRDIVSERLLPEEVVGIEMADEMRVDAMLRKYAGVLRDEFVPGDSNCVFRCGAGTGSFDVSSDGIMRPCISLWHPDFLYDWRRGSVADAWQRFFPSAMGRISHRKEFIEKCRRCSLINLCMWCPANAYLETREMDMPVDFFCKVAYSRLVALKAKQMVKKMG
jgi:radical SAM protein with 4Fe4S-binding SPASM domain